MPDFTKAQNVTRTDAKLLRAGRAKDVIDTLQNQRMTLPEIAEESGIGENALERLLPELQRYGILAEVTHKGHHGRWKYSVSKPSKIESLKADLMADPQASD